MRRRIRWNWNSKKHAEGFYRKKSIKRKEENNNFKAQQQMTGQNDLKTDWIF